MEAQAKEMMQAILGRRTARRFQHKDVSDEIIMQLMGAAFSAPTRLGRKPWQFVVIRSPEIKAQLGKLLRLEDAYLHAPVFVAVCAEKGVTETWDLDAGAATQNLLVAASAMGLASAWIASPINPAWERLSEVFFKLTRAPAGIGLVAIVALGYPAEELPAHTEQEVYEQQKVHFENWNDTRGA